MVSKQTVFGGEDASYDVLSRFRIVNQECYSLSRPHPDLILAILKNIADAVLGQAVELCVMLKMSINQAMENTRFGAADPKRVFVINQYRVYLVEGELFLGLSFKFDEL